MPTLAGTTALSSVAVERLTPPTGATEEDPATTGEATPSSIVLPTIEDDTTAAAEVSSTAFTDFDEAAGRSTPLTGATEDHPPMEEDPTSTAEGNTSTPTEVSASVFPDVDEAARQPTPLTEGAPTSVVVATTEGDTTAAAEVSSTIVAETDGPIAAVDLAASTIDDD
ncbi:hypothetical protein E2562_021620 [Oryza meyeriana var. granulata]|uniref:Uncharacterized protein n=1 Tax=Oryza meyeriana var. granulata TaxID=110450 RepID=A0A6G1DYD6_9ORYZ|nr:hypothetical protein E2562_021620 [Oryza meyeriana var. granulata]